MTRDPIGATPEQEALADVLLGPPVRIPPPMDGLRRMLPSESALADAEEREWNRWLDRIAP